MMKSKQQGLTLLELLVGIGLASMMTVLLANTALESQQNIRAQNTAQYQKAVANAAQAWIKDNYSTVQAAATSTTPHRLTVGTLVADRYLASGFSAVNPFNQTACILTLEPTPNKLETMVVTEGGTDIGAGQVPKIANLIGTSGGFILSSGSTAQGSYGSWSRNITSFISTNCSGTAASANRLASALFIDGSDLANDFLYRSSVPGHPELNTMTTPLMIDSVKAVGDPCTTTGSITTAADGALLTCQSGAFAQQGSAYWKDPVLNFASLPACNAAAAWQTRIVQTPTVGTGARAYSCNGAGVWNPLSVDNNGNLTAAGTASVGKVQINDVVTENAACTPNGLVARDTVGVLLSCQSGLWKKAQGDPYSLGVGQTWQNPSRSSGTVYTNTTGKPIMVSVGIRSTNGWIYLTAYCNGVMVGRTEPTSPSSTSGGSTFSFVVPNGHTYQVIMTAGSFTHWSELR